MTGRDGDGARAGGLSQVNVLLRLEGALALALALVTYVRIDGSWWLFLALILAPDLALLGYVRSPAVGAWAYNLAHTYIAPLLLAAAGFGLGMPYLVPVAAIWVAHIGVDRLFGFGLKYPTHQKDQHFARL
jgi:hypothetical protein